MILQKYIVFFSHVFVYCSWCPVYDACTKSDRRHSDVLYDLEKPTVFLMIDGNIGI